MRIRASHILILAAIAIALFGSYSFYKVITPRTVARAVAPDGTEMCIVQWFNWSSELFTTRFMYRQPGGTWGEFYFDHQDDFWASSRVTVDPATQTAVFDRDGKPAITFVWPSATYTMHRRNGTTTGSQWTRPADWSPPGAH